MKIKSFTDKEESPQVDLTPLIDVVFILLIFFILSANFQKESTMEVDRPSASSSSLKPKAETISVSVDRDHNIWFNGQNVNLSQLQFQVKAYLVDKKPINAIVNADRSLDTGTLISVIDTLRLSGLNNVAIATKEQ
ncbi:MULTISPECIES: ExbD/TolR family protein [Vibrio]|uniref:Biopolymer transporter ExbD n=1 Tax=Vibrio harveyi TaxID=669 RepID=A0A8B3DG76_VIBHA|nr:MULTISPECIES: biopolymer transporter ExbD [Vibrio]EKM18256.1 biopolymer transport ExbD/TolR family protein [Vibrio harveyi]EKY4192878.1 biopolymer transporter ExbD [Vibrio harveyi]EKY4198070.1 biopolymer transporter ExbD [Vibrio harveyi]EMB9228394.1 biopolymer transporter ExbD [Vibrio harveyi]RIW01856.1 biopolymer transporter ExbD [Vibrio harveyi]